MQATISRPGTVRGGPAAGLLLADHFQVAYTTNDMAAAQALLGERYGVREFRDIEGALPAGGHMHAAFAWVGSVMYELICAEGPGSTVYRHGLPETGGFALRHHHLGYLVYTEEDWQALHRAVADGGFTLVYENNTEGFLRHLFVDAPELGHYLEYILPEPAGLEFLQGVPAN